MPNSLYFTREFASFDVAHDIVLTPNERLSRFVRDAYAAYQLAQGKRAFQSVTSLSYHSWLLAQWQKLTGVIEHPAAGVSVLSALQEFQAWQNLIAAHPETPPLLNLAATAQAVADAWALRHEWQLNLDELNHAQNLQSHLLFREWSQAFQDWCVENSVISRAQLPVLLLEAFTKGVLSVPRCVWLNGFDEHSPTMAQLLETLQHRGSRVEHMELQQTPETVTRHVFSDQRSEQAVAASWSYRLVQHNPQARIGIVVPDLTAQRANLVRAFNEVFEPDAKQPGQAQHAPGFNLSAGQPLATVPLVQAALAALQLNHREQTVDALTALLLSPFLGSNQESHQRARLDVVLRKQGELQPGRQLLITCAVEFCDADEQPLCDDFYHRLTEFDRLAKQHSSRRYVPSEWLGVFTAQLQSLGWPGDRSLDTLEYQQLQAWLESLDEFAALDLATGKLTLSDALSALRRCLQQRSFQAQTRPSPVQILGVLEAAGLPFDYLWVMGLDDETWPPAPAPNPLLPLSLQIARNTPQSSAERETLYATRLTQRWQRSCRHLVVSHAAQKDDKQQLPSPLIEALPCTDNPAGPEPGLAVLQLLQSGLETLIDNHGGAIADPQQISGGSAILRDMAACPFQSFARHRLHATEIEEIEVGLNAAERGNLVHHAMEIVWRQLKDSERLHAIDADDLNTLIGDAIAKALVGVRRKNFVGYRFVELESSRLQRLIFEWLQLEKQRTPFAVVFNESRRNLELAGLPLRIRYDRVDQLRDGELFVIDYKTGTSRVRAWEGSRPDEPQIPLYAIANRDKVIGAAFAQINSREIALKGLCEDADIAPGLEAPETIKNLDLPETWSAILDHWQATLESLASEFLAGNATVDPKHPATTCRYCELRGFCRIRERFDSADATGEDAV